MYDCENDRTKATDKSRENRQMPYHNMPPNITENYIKNGIKTRVKA